MDLCCGGILPLETGLLLSVRVSVVLDRLEDASSQLCSQAAESALLLQILNYNVLEIVHYLFILNLQNF